MKTFQPQTKETRDTKHMASRPLVRKVSCGQTDWNLDFVAMDTKIKATHDK